MNDAHCGKEMAMHPWTRASDAERDHVIEALHQHTTAGRLSLDEFTDRLDAAHHATTHGELAAITTDLPAEAPARHGGTRRPLLAAAILTVALALLLAVLALAGWGHMHTMMAATTTTMAGRQ